MNFWDFIWWMLWVYVFIAYLYALFAILRDIFRDPHLNGWLRAVWIIFLIFVPFLTALIYVIVRGRGMAERSAASQLASRQASDAYIQQVAGTGKSPSEEIAAAAKLRADGTITQDEYERLKARAIG
ncbi:SHOCT domain-containing protein [Planctomonas sp. JC2975]|uniref:SHOCT domain-containing protein n=1 Tax=Planctomonas sp. JC2975 TaxID=2729626 RepID=UPI001472DE58|nr:SHOCT domain-containing protein [Planctomonas sp. JC2975]NNC11631.1 SHOCT domain-containing protein [Planctomonas sp. JC2975]